MSMPQELLRKVYEIEIIAKKEVRELFPGVHESVFLGEGFNFAKHREYQPGDDVKSIDWHLMARFPDKVYVRLFKKYKHMTIWILVDVSNSNRFGFSDLTKRELLIKLIAFLGFSAVARLDNVGLIAFTNKIKKQLAPKSGKGWVYYVLEEIWRLLDKSGKTDIVFSLKKARNFIGESDMVVLASDFLDDNCFKRDSSFWKEIRNITGRHDLIPVVLEEDESFLLDVKGNTRLRDLESEKSVNFYLSPKNRAELKKETEEKHQILRDGFMESNARAIFIKEEADLRKLMKFFLIRKRGKLR